MRASSERELFENCPDCLYVDEVLGILASRHLAEAVRWFLDALADVHPPSDQSLRSPTIA